MKKILLTPLVLLIVTVAFAQSTKKNPIPIHTYFEYGFAKNNNPAPVKLDNHTYFAAGLKFHGWKEDRPILLEVDVDYRKVDYYTYDTLNANSKVSFGMAELLTGPRLMISKTSPLYPTLSLLGGAYYNFKGSAGFDAIATLGIYYNLTPPGTKRNGISFEFVYRPVSCKIDNYEIPSSLGFKIGFFF
jgi:hypothetical protein